MLESRRRRVISTRARRRQAGARGVCRLGRFGRAMTAPLLIFGGAAMFHLVNLSSSLGESSVRVLFSSVLHVDLRCHGDGAEFVGYLDNVLSILALAR